MNWPKTFVFVLLALVAIAGLSACEVEELDAPLDTGPEAVGPSGPGDETLASTGVDRLGIEGLNLIPEIAEAQGLPASQKGVLVERVVPASPSAEAGLRGGDQTVTIAGEAVLIGGDVIVGFADQHVDNLQDLGGYLLVAQPNQLHTLSIVRNGEVTQVEVELGDLPEIDEP